MRVRVVSSVTDSAFNHHYSLFSVCAYFIQLYLLRAIRLTRHYMLYLTNAFNFNSFRSKTQYIHSFITMQLNSHLVKMSKAVGKIP